MRICSFFFKSTSSGLLRNCSVQYFCIKIGKRRLMHDKQVSDLFYLQVHLPAGFTGCSAKAVTQLQRIPPAVIHTLVLPEHFIHLAATHFHAQSFTRVTVRSWVLLRVLLLLICAFSYYIYSVRVLLKKCVWK